MAGSDRTAPEVSREELLAMTPNVIREALPAVPWDLDKLQSLDRPAEQVAVADLDWLLDLPVWQLAGRRFQVSPRAVRDDPAHYPDHIRRVMAADLRHPIHVVQHRRRLVVLDGFHRLLKAVIQNQANIDAVVLSDGDLESICQR